MKRRIQPTAVPACPIYRALPFPQVAALQEFQIGTLPKNEALATQGKERLFLKFHEKIRNSGGKTEPVALFLR